MAKRPSAKPYKPKPKSNWKRYLIIGLLALALISFILTSIPQGTPPATGPVFRDDGDLTLIDADTNQPITELDIELALTEETITRGLMYRESMEDDQGMLFIFNDEIPRSFWMLNTYIPLDIIFVSADKRIVSIRENTTPRSTDQILSGAPAAYVLEVNAGFAKKHGLSVGDELSW